MNEKIKLEFMHLCDYASPGLDNKLNIMGIFDFFFRPKALDFFIVTKITVKTKASYKVSFEIKSKEDSTKVFIDNNPIQIPADAPTLEYNILKQMRGVDFGGSGQFIFTILVNDLPIGYKEVEVKSQL